MQARATLSVRCDPWRAGFEVGEKLASLKPEVVFLFCTIHYEEDFLGLLEGLEEGLGFSGALVFGCTGDSVLVGGEIATVGLAGMGVTSQGTFKWSLQVEPGAEDAPRAAQRAADRLIADLGDRPDVAFVLVDGVQDGGIRSDGAEMVEVLNLALSCPLMGGLAGDDRQFRRTFVLAHGQAWPSAVALLGGRGPIRSAIHSASGFTPLEEVGIIEESEGDKLIRISGLTAQEFLRGRLGKAASEGDVGTMPLALSVPEGYFVLRTPRGFERKTGALHVSGHLLPGTEIRPCEVDPSFAIEGVREDLARLESVDFKPDFALSVTCAGRRWLFGQSYDLGVRELGTRMAGIPMAGFLSFGEIGPFMERDGRRSPSYYHNATLVLGAFGG
jgi:hypothetical protein